MPLFSFFVFCLKRKKKPVGGGAGAGASRACSLVIGPYNRAASALPLTSQLGGPPLSLSYAEAPQLCSPASALPIAPDPGTG